MVKHFQYAEGFRVLLVSPDVGGAGWNFQFAARSFLLERPFNPAVESQMIARTWRMGQTRPVEIVAPVAVLAGAETFDQVLDQLLEDKRELAVSVLSPSVVKNAEIARRFAGLVE
jgi:SNF2 family DNA or RNA helicase